MRHVQTLHELPEPRFEVESVVQDQVGLGRLADIAGRWLVAVDFGACLGDGLHRQLVPRNVPGHIRQHRKGGQHHGLLTVAVARRIAAAGCKGQGEEDDGGSTCSAQPRRLGREGPGGYFGAPKQKVRHTEYSTGRRTGAAM